MASWSGSVDVDSWCGLGGGGTSCCVAWDASGNWAASIQVTDNTLITGWAWAITELNTAVAVTLALVCTAALVVLNGNKILTVVACWDSLWALNVLA
jgi:hypothetical protein